MDVKKAIKKVVALGAGATMVGATIMGAMAADLANYPSMFIKDGSLNAVIVVGDGAAAKDVIGSVDIATNLQYSLKTTKTVSTTGGASTTVSVDGDAWEVKTSSKSLEIGDNISSVQSVVDEDELAALSGGTFRSGKNTADYEEELRFYGQVALAYEEDTDNDKIGAFLTVDNNDNLALYTLTFTSTSDTDIDSSETSQLEDFKDKKISIMGTLYTITKATFSATTAELTLMGGALSDTISEGETKTYTLQGKDYEVENIIVTDSGTIKTQFKINGVVTDEMQEGDTYTLDDGIDVGIKTVLNNEAGDVTGDLVDFYLGADKIVIKDTTVTASSVDGTLHVGDEKMDEVTAGIKATNDSSEFKMETIKLNFTADDDYWFAPGEKLSEKLEEPEGLINWDILYEGMTSADTRDINIVPSGYKRLELKMTVEDGAVSLPLAYSPNATYVYMGDNNDRLTLDRTTNIVKDQFFFLTTGSGTPSSEGEKSYVLQYRGADSSSGDATASVKFKNLATKENFERTFSIATAGTATLTLGGTEFTISNQTAANAGTDDFNISIAGGASNGYLVTKGEALIRITQNETFYNNQNATYDDNDEIRVNVTEVDPSNMLEGDAQTTIVNVVSDGDANEVSLATPTFTGSGYTPSLVTDTDDTDIQSLMTAYGAEVTFTSITSSPDKVEVKWPDSQRVGQIFVTSGAVTSNEVAATSSGAGTVETVSLTKIQVGAAQLASNVRGQETSQNLILVGGACINEAAAAVAGWPFVNGQPQYGADKCAMGLEAGMAKIKLYENGDNVAMLVAGYGADDTKRATTVVANHDQYADSLMGMEVEVSGTSMTDITVSKVEATAAAPVAEEAPAADAEAEAPAAE